MRRRKFLPVSTMIMILIIALALLGVGYSIWSQSLFINGTVITGNVRAIFTRAFTDDDGTVNNPTLDSQDTGDCAISIAGDPSCDPAANGVDPKLHHDKAVASCKAAILSDPTLGEVIQNNVYPGYFCTAWFAVQNRGTIPVKVGDILINGQSVTPGIPTPFDLSGDGLSDISMYVTGVNLCQQIDPGETVLLDVDHEILNDAPQATSMGYKVEVQLNQWNEECNPPALSLPVYEVTQAGLTQAQAAALAESLGIPADQMVLVDGKAMFIDPANFQYLPTTPVDVSAFGGRSENDGGKIEGQAFDFAAIAKITPMSDQAALRKVFDAFEKAGTDVGNGRPQIMHSEFEAVDTQGRPVVEGVMLDTHVRYHFMLGGIPMIGPGAQVNVAFSPQGAPTQLLYSLYSVEAGSEVPILPPDQAAAQCALLNPGTEGKFEPRLVYYAPSLEDGGTQTLLPHYDCGGTTQMGDEQASLLHQLLPAVQNSELVPSVSLTASAQGGNVHAEAAVSGGTAPYSYSWGATSADLSGVPADASSVDYDASSRAAGELEVIQVVVTDANGVQTQAITSIALGGRTGLFVLPTSPRRAAPRFAGGITDFGVERAVSDLGAGNQSGYVNRMDDEAFKRFNWTGASAWETDFRQGGPHLDHLMVDNVDTLFYIGHGNGGGFTFESNQTDGSIVPSDVVNTWGNLDLEWLTLLSCQVLKYEHGGKLWYQRWGPAMDGLHQITGFQTNAYDWPAFGGRFADYMLGRNFGFFQVDPLKVRSAWFQAALEEQPDGVQAVVMGVYGPGGLTSYNDYFWGQGGVSPDLRGADKWGYWRVVVTVP